MNPGGLKMANKGYLLTDYQQEKEYQEGRFNPKAIFANERQKVILGYFKAGQFIPAHKPGVDLVLYIIEGEGEVLAAEDRFPVKAGQLLVVPAGLRRGILARSDMTILHVVSPPPTEADHAQVKAGLQKGVFAE
jgi:quercetin dioxygenase-like cupin family protein